VFETGSIMKAVGVSAGAPITKEGLGELQKAWMEVYLVFLMLMTKNPAMKSDLTAVTEKLAEANEAVSGFFENALSD